jgi:hypothetical protein
MRQMEFYRFWLLAKNEIELEADQNRALKVGVPPVVASV